LDIKIKYQALSRVIKAARLLEQALAAMPPEDRERQGRGVQFDSVRARQAVKKRWQNSSMQKALRKLGDGKA
jgi:hypothetical protein